MTDIKELEKKYKTNYYKGKSSAPCEVKKYGSVPILISAPHSVKQRRNNKTKNHEFYTGAIAEFLAQELKCSVITKQYLIEDSINDDANYEDSRCSYKTAINQFLQQNDVKLFVDIHGLSSNKNSIVDICTNNGINTDNTEYAFNLKARIDKAFNEMPASIDKYYKADASNVLSKWVKDTYNIPAIELEINGAYRWFDGEYLEPSTKLLSTMYEWLIECRDLLCSIPNKLKPSCAGCNYKEACQLCDGDPECQI